MARDPKGPPDLDEFDLHPDELKALRKGGSGVTPGSGTTGDHPPAAPSRPRVDASDLDEFDFAPMPKSPPKKRDPATIDRSIRLPPEHTTPSPRPQRDAAALDEFDLPPAGDGPVGLPVARGHVFKKPRGVRVPGVNVPDPGADPAPPRRPSTKGARARADDHRTYAVKGAGPDVFRLFHRLLALCFLLAFWSLGQQVDVLIGPRGLLPVGEFMDVLRVRDGAGFAQFPTFFWWGTDPSWITGGISLGLGLSVAALLGIVPRFLLIALVPLYLGYATVCRSFLSFQWDSMLLEAGLLAVLLPRDIRSPVMLFGFRLLLFKLYFESGLAKYQSHLGDWIDGSAMVRYYETAPLPTAAAWFAHQLPVAWHNLESYAALALELIVPFFIFGPRFLRRVAFVSLTGFQLVNFATANYGFFIPLTLALHAFLLDDRDLRAVGATVRSLLGMHAKRRIAVADWRPPWLRTLGPYAALLIVGGWLAVSGVQGAQRFVPEARLDTKAPLVASAAEALAPFRVVNNYHLFGHITRTRVEPEFQTLAGVEWRSHHLHYKPGDPETAPRFVAPHQPRVDFRLWFYGLNFERGTPQYVQTLLRRLCHEPEVVQPLFRAPLAKAPDAVRIRFMDYRYTDWETRSKTGLWWTREEVAVSAPMACTDATGLGAAARSVDVRTPKP